MCAFGVEVQRLFIKLIPVFRPLIIGGNIGSRGLIRARHHLITPQPASAIPNGLPHADQISNVEQVRWVCNPWGHCWWRRTTIAPSASTLFHASVIAIGGFVAGTIAAGAG